MSASQHYNPLNSNITVWDGLNETILEQAPISSRQVISQSIKWPMIQSQQQLAHYAQLQLRNQPIYPEQGKRLGEIFIHYGQLSPKTVATVCAIQKRPMYQEKAFGELLRYIGILERQEDLSHALMLQAGIMMVDMLLLDVPEDVSRCIPFAEQVARQVVPVGICEDILYVAVANPFQFVDQAYLAQLTSKKVKLVYASSEGIQHSLQLAKLKNGQVSSSEFWALAHADVSEEVPAQPSVEIVERSDSTIVNLVNQILNHSIQIGASDIHIELFGDELEANIRLRRDGHIELFSNMPKIYYKPVVSRLKILANLDISNHHLPQDGKIAFTTSQGQRVDLRISTIPAGNNVEFVTIRVLAAGKPVPLENLGFCDRDMSAFRAAFQHPHGLIVVCGPTGSGKTTSLHSVLNELNTPERKIWTAEDPVEITHHRLCQVQINQKSGLTFAHALRSFLRADPDVIMVGETRDKETAHITLEAAMTGHLVFSTLHTNSAAETVARLLALDVDPFNLADALIAVLSQRLVRRLCRYCAVHQAAKSEEIEQLANEYFYAAHHTFPSQQQQNLLIQQWQQQFGEKLYLAHAHGCKKCQHGYSGRLGIYELLINDAQSQQLIYSQAGSTAYKQYAVNNGMTTLKQDGMIKVLQGLTDMKQVREVCG